MSGLEVVAGVAAIVSAFTGAGTLLHQWRQKRQAKKAAVQGPQYDNADTALVQGRTQLQSRYDTDFARLGPKFARGDDIGRMSIMGELIALQQAFIALQSAVIAAAGGPLDLGGLALSSDARRRGTLDVLTQQFQRMLTAGPIAAAPLPPPVQGSGSASRPPDTPCPGARMNIGSRNRCVRCSFSYAGEISSKRRHDWRLVQDYARRHHVVDGDGHGHIRCPRYHLEGRSFFDLRSFVSHLRLRHPEISFGD